MKRYLFLIVSLISSIVLVSLTSVEANAQSRDRSYIREQISHYGECRNVAITKRNGDLMLYGKPHIPFVEVSDDAKAITVTLGAPSKTFNVPGLVSSWIIVKNEALRTPFFHWLEVNEFSSPTMFATIGAEVAYTHGEEWLNQMTSYIEESIEVIDDYLKKNIPQIKIFRPQASFLLWLDCRELKLSQDELVNLFVNKAKLALNNGTMFGKEGEGFMRLNIGSPRSVILEALAQLADAVKSL